MKRQGWATSLMVIIHEINIWKYHTQTQCGYSTFMLISILIQLTWGKKRYVGLPGVSASRCVPRRQHLLSAYMPPRMTPEGKVLARPPDLPTGRRPRLYAPAVDGPQTLTGGLGRRRFPICQDWTPDPHPTPTCFIIKTTTMRLHVICVEVLGSVK